MLVATAYDTPCYMDIAANRNHGDVPYTSTILRHSNSILGELAGIAAKLINYICFGIAWCCSIPKMGKSGVYVKRFDHYIVETKITCMNGHREQGSHCCSCSHISFVPLLNESPQKSCKQCIITVVIFPFSPVFVVSFTFMPFIFAWIVFSSTVVSSNLVWDLKLTL